MLAEPIDDMEGGLDSIAGCKSYVHGQPPALKWANKSVRKEGQVHRRVLSSRDWIWTAESPRPRSELRSAKKRWSTSKIEHALKAAGIGNVDSGEGWADDDDAVRVGTMHRVKGLEFRCMCVAVLAQAPNWCPPPTP